MTKKRVRTVGSSRYRREAGRGLVAVMVYVTPELWDWVAVQAARTGTSKSEVVRQALTTQRGGGDE